MAEKTLHDLATETDLPAEAIGLAGALLVGSMQQNIGTVNVLWEMERRRRQALEVRLERFLVLADRAYMGTMKEYETAINYLRYPQMLDAEYAALHEENQDG